MDWNLKFFRRSNNAQGVCSGRVGWFFNDEANSVIFADPERLRSVDVNLTHAKSAARCPAVISLESRYFLIRCPFDISLSFHRTNEGRPALKNLLGDMSTVRPKGLERYLMINKESEWRYPDRPTLQITLPYVFISDEPVYINQLPPFMHFLDNPWPGTLFGGRFPIQNWPRSLTWAFEWHDLSKPLILKRGAPWFYVSFENAEPDRPIRLFEAEKTPELMSYMNSIGGAVNYVNQTFSLFKTAAARRPRQLLKPVRR